jgi:hypothetical protein
LKRKALERAFRFGGGGRWSSAICDPGQAATGEPNLLERAVRMLGFREPEWQSDQIIMPLRRLEERRR